MYAKVQICTLDRLLSLIVIRGCTGVAWCNYRCCQCPNQRYIYTANLVVSYSILMIRRQHTPFIHMTDFCIQVSYNQMKLHNHWWFSVVRFLPYPVHCNLVLLHIFYFLILIYFYFIGAIQSNEIAQSSVVV